MTEKEYADKTFRIIMDNDYYEIVRSNLHLVSLMAVFAKDIWDMLQEEENER